MITVRRHLLHLASVVPTIMAIIVVTPVVADASGAAPSASSVISTTKAAIAKESGVHVLLTSKTSSSSTKVVADIGATRGMETITEGSGSVTIKVTSTYAYLSGNAAGLKTLMGLTAQEQAKVGTGVMSMKAGTTPYKNLKSSVTIPVLANLLPNVTGTSSSTVTIGGRHFYELDWTTKATSSTSKSKAVLTLSEGATVLPMREIATAATGTSTTTFSKWGENINVSVPSNSKVVTYSKVFG